MPPLIHTNRLTKLYPMGPETVRALVDVSVSIQPGEFVAIMGPSGSGKSTFMNLLGCLDTPSQGHYAFEGTYISELSSDALADIRAHKIGFVFQSFNLLARTSALKNVEMPLAYSNCPRPERRGRAASVLKKVGLADRMDHLPTQLSGGQQQRVAIARALVNRPALVLADEPTGALDSRTGAEIIDLIKNLNVEGMTIVMVTHEAEVASHARRILRFHDGRLVEDSAASSAKPRLEAVAT